MTISISLDQIPDPGLVGKHKATSKLGTFSPESCPVCGQSGADVWLQAPDRLHGRLEKYTLVRCHRCSLVWLSNPPQPSEMHLHYTDAYHKMISDGGQNSPIRWRDRKAALTPHKQSGTLLDLGCSSGAFLQSMSGEAWKLYGIEMSAEVARVAEARSGAQVFVGDILNAPFPRESFDVVTCFDVLEHLYEPRRVFARIGEWLKPEGIFYVLVPNVNSAEARVFGSYWQGLELPRHLFHYSPKSLTFLAQSAGLSVASLETRRNPTIETSLHYVWDDVLRTLGLHRTPVVNRRPPSLPRRAAHKLNRMTILRCLLALAPLVGAGESIHAIFRKGIHHRS